MEKIVNLKHKFSSVFIIVLLLVVSSYSLTTMADPPDDFSLKWICITGLDGSSPLVTKDINGDGVHEIFFAGKIIDDMDHRLMCIDGLTGSIIWQKDFNHEDGAGHVPLSIGDLNNDGDFKIVHSKVDGTTARYCSNGTIFWDVDTPAGWHQFVIADVDDTGYPYVYVSDHDDVYPYDAKVSKLYGTNGSVAAQAPHYYSCYGGVSAADLDGDGNVEVVVSDRNFGQGMGIKCYDEDLNLLWNYDAVGCSSHCSVIVDVDEDGVLDVVVMYQNYHNGGGICVIDGSTGEPMPGKNQANCWLSTHCQPAVYDIDNDGNLELITATHQEDTKVWDLVDWSLDATFSDQCSEPPDFANVMGDNDLEIISCSGFGDKIYNGDYELVYSLPTCSARSVVQDIDNDGLNELILQDIFGVIRAYDTFADSPTPEVRTDTPYYSERRTGAAEYIALIGDFSGINAAPVFSESIPDNESTDVSLDISYLSVNIEDPEGNTFSWAIETSPDVGSGFDSGDSNGSKSCSISGLDYSTIYFWFVNATDGEHWTREFYSFVTEDEPNTSPSLSNEMPSNESVNVTRPIHFVNVTVVDADGDLMDIYIRWKNHDEIWTILETYMGVDNGTYNFVIPGENDWMWGNTTYVWSANALDGIIWTNETYQFITGGSRYDVNGDDIVNFSDSGLVWLHRTSEEEYDGLFDVNQDCLVNFQDAGLTWMNRN